MVQNAIVKQRIGEGVVQVSLLRQMECGLHCDGACAGCTQKPTQEILALASEPTSGHNISTSVMLCLLPCVGLGAGYMLGQSLLHLGDIAALGTALLGLVLGFVPAWLINRAILRSKAPEFAVLKLLH